MKLISVLVRLYIALLLISGATLLFLPEIASPAVDSADPRLLVLAQLLGASLLAFAAGNWTARGAILGGIYGRAVVVGNQAFAFVGTLVLLKNLATESGSAFWFLFLVLAFGGVLYSVLMFRPALLVRSSPESATNQQ